MHLICVYIHTHTEIHRTYICILKAQIIKLSALFSIHGIAEYSHWMVESPLFIWEQEPHSFLNVKHFIPTRFSNQLSDPRAFPRCFLTAQYVCHSIIVSFYKTIPSPRDAQLGARKQRTHSAHHPEAGTGSRRNRL